MKASGKPKILILSGDLGEGHKQAANAIGEAARLRYPGMEVEVVDFMAWAYPRMHNIGRYCYTQWVTKFPSVYGYLFQKTRDENTMSHLFKKMKFYTLSRIVKLLLEARPTVVVSTFPGAAAAMSLLKAHGLTDVPTATVITDHTDHSYWLHPYTDRYLVGSDHVKDALMRHGIPEQQIAVTGIPIRPEFGQAFDREELRRKHGLNPGLPVVLVMGGGLGMIGKDFAAMLQASGILKDIQFIIVCGRNEKARLRFEEEFRHAGSRIHVMGYVRHVHELMALSDLLITKPGGLTTSEAVAMELPMLLYRPLPGQERDNASFLVDNGVALLAGDEWELEAHLADLFRHPILLRALKAQTKSHQRKNAAFLALAAILETKGAYVPHHKVGRAVYARA